VIDEHFNKTEKTKSRIDELLAENQEMELCDSRNRTKLIKYEKILTSRSCVGLVRSVKVKSLTLQQDRENEIAH
jgi:hypothetical protein